MKELKDNDSNVESTLKEIELLEEKDEFSCVINVCPHNSLSCIFNHWWW